MFGGAGNSNLSMDQAMRNSTVWACVRLLADAVSMMPLHAFTMQSGVRVPISDPPIVAHPSSDATTPDFIYMVMVSLLLRGNAYGRILRRDALGYPVEIELMDPDVLRAHVDRATGKMVYQTPTEGVVPSDQIWHVRAYRLPGRPFGLSPIQYASTQINTDAAIQTFALGYFQDAPHPSSVLTSDQSINQEQARTIKERLIASVSGREPLVLGAGLKFSGLSVSPNESQFLETQKAGVATITRFFGIQPEQIGGTSGNSMTYTNIESKGIDLLTYGVQPWLTRLESAYAQLMPGKQHARFDPSVLTRTDLEGRTKAGAIAIASKQQTPDEVRAWSDLPPLTDEQKAWLEIIPLTTSPTGLPKSTLPKSAPTMDATATEGEPA